MKVNNFFNIRNLNKKTKVIVGTVLAIIALLVITIVAIKIRDQRNRAQDTESETIRLTEATEEAMEIETETEEVQVIEPEDTDYVLVTDYIPDLIVELKYATTDNFTGKLIYNFDQAYLRYGTVKKLMQVADDLRAKGYRLKIWDAYRPFYAQEKLWEVYPVSTYVANPANGPKAHNLGGTIDITITDLEGNTVTMPTGFDDFSTKADRDYSDCTEEEKTNAMLLQSTMESYGFKPYSGEWWDFSDTTTYEYEDFIPPVNETLQKELDAQDGVSSDANSENSSSESTSSDSKQSADTSSTRTGDSALSQELAKVAKLSVAASTDQLMLVAGTGGSSATFSMYQKDSSGNWSKLLSCNAYVGKAGIGKASEYTSYSPQGVHGFCAAFGIKANPGCSLNYAQVDSSYYWVDDVNSAYYNKFVSTNNLYNGAQDWTSAEHIIDCAPAYDYVLAMDYNYAYENGSGSCVAGNGSAFFLHCMNSTSYTAGCVAIPESDMITVMQNVKSDCKIVIDYASNIWNY